MRGLKRSRSAQASTKTISGESRKMRVNWSKRFLKAALLISAFAIAGCAANQLPVEESKWDTHLGDYARTNVSTGKVALPLVIGWDRDVSDFRFFRPFPKEQLSSPAIYKGRLYAGSANGYFYASDLASGKVYWKFNAKAPIEAAPTVTDEKVCLARATARCGALTSKANFYGNFRPARKYS